MEILPRTQLIERLQNRSIHFIGIVGPHGYGKTTLQRLYQQADPSSIYIQLSDADPTPVEIARLIGLALIERFGRNTDYRMQFEMQRPSLSASGASGAVAHDLNMQPCTVLVDEAHLLDNEGREWFLKLFPKLGRNVRFIFAMHAPENMQFAHLALSHGVSTLTVSDLKFNIDELQLLGLNEAELALTDGWPAAVMLSRKGLDARLFAEALLSTLTEDLLRDLKRMSLVTTWAVNDQLHQALELKDGWLHRARLLGVPLNRVAENAFQPHTIVRSLLLDQLRARPQEYQEAQRVLAGALSESQPLTAAEAYLAAGERDQARQLLLHNAESLEVTETTADAYHLLMQLQPGAADPLHVMWIKARFLRGEVVQALEMAEAATRVTQGQQHARLLAILGSMRLRLGNVNAATQSLQSAADLMLDENEATLVRAELAMALALASRVSGTRFADGALSLAMRVREASEHQAFSDPNIMANTAQMVAYARKGMRVMARERADWALGLIQRRSGGHVVLTCLLQIAGFLADEGELEHGQEVFELALTFHPWQINDQSLQGCMMQLTAARLALRAGSPEALVLAGRALILAQAFKDDTFTREARYFHLAAVIAAGQIPTEDLDALRFKLRSDDFTPVIIRLVETVFVQQHEIHPRDLHLVQALPLDLRALVLLGCVQLQGSQDSPRPWLTDLVDVRRALGPGAIMQYAQSLGVQLPAHLTLHLNLDLELLRGKPRARLNGLLIELTANQMVWLIAAAFSPNQTLRADDLAKLDTESKKQFSNVKKKLKDVLGSFTGRSDAVQANYGSFGLPGWQVTSDLERLEQAGLDEIERLYRSEVFADLGGDYNLLLGQLRARARETVIRRLAAFDAQGLDVTAVYLSLIRRDPALKPMFNPRPVDMVVR